MFARRFHARPDDCAPTTHKTFLEKAEPIDAGLTGGLGRIPGRVLTATSLSVEARFLVAFRCIHVCGGGRRGYGLNHRRVRKALCAGFGRKVFQRAIRKLREAGVIAREQWGQFYALGRLTFAPSRSGFMLVEPALFAGSLTARDVVAILYLRLCGRQLALPWQLRKVLQEKIALVDYVEVGDPTANILRVAREEGAVLILIGDVPPSIVQRILPAIGLSIATITSQVVQRATVPVVALK